MADTCGSVKAGDIGAKRRADDATNCSFYMKRFKRNCRDMAVAGSTMCEHHAAAKKEQVVKERERIPCPLDGKHTGRFDYGIW